MEAIRRFLGLRAVGGLSVAAFFLRGFGFGSDALGEVGLELGGPGGFSRRGKAREDDQLG